MGVSLRSHKTFNSLLKKILTSRPFTDQPPVVMDLGASGQDPRWADVAEYCTIIAIDADSRDFNSEDSRFAAWNRSELFNACVTDSSEAFVSFHLTQDPHCSSALSPRSESLSPWMFAPKFELVSTVTLPAITPREMLRQSQIDYVDWIKLDTQGTDLRLLLNLPAPVWRGASIIQMEPGILDSYEGEDKLHHVLERFASEDYFVSNLDVRGTQRIDPNEWANQDATIRRWPDRVLPPSAGWAEVTFLRAFTGEAPYTERELLWGWVCSMNLAQWGHALHIARLGGQATSASVFADCEEAARNAISGGKLQAYAEGAKRAGRRISTRR